MSRVPWLDLTDEGGEVRLSLFGVVRHPEKLEAEIAFAPKPFHDAPVLFEGGRRYRPPTLPNIGLLVVEPVFVERQIEES